MWVWLERSAVSVTQRSGAVQRIARLHGGLAGCGSIVFTLRGIEHGQVVIRLWQVGKVLDQRVKDLNGFRVLLLLGGD